MCCSNGDRKSRALTFLFSFVGGLFGLHHLYLGRTQHALLWLTTLGGFGFGFVYEFCFYISKYVREANEEPSAFYRYKLKILQRKSPAFELYRFCGQYLTALFYGFITYYAFPETWHKEKVRSLFVAFSTALAIALGTKLAGTIGPRRCSLVWPLLGATLGIPFLIWRSDSSPSFNLATFLASLIFEWKIEWDFEFLQSIPMPTLKSSESSSPKVVKSSRKRQHSCFKRCLLYALGGCLFAGVFTSTLYQNLVVDINGQRVKIKDVLKDFFRSQEFIRLCEQLLRIVRQLWHFYLSYGFKGIWTRIWAIMDSESENQAFHVLNLSNDASQKSVEAQCRTLSRQWHPDRFRGVEEKEKAEVTFMNIQQACNRLSNERKRRQFLNTKQT